MQLLRSTLLLLFFMHPKYALELFSRETTTPLEQNLLYSKLYKLFQQCLHLSVTKVKVYPHISLVDSVQSMSHKKNTLAHAICSPPPSSPQQHEWPQITVQHTTHYYTMYSLCVLGTDHLSLFTASSSKLPKPMPLDWTVCSYALPRTLYRKPRRVVT